MNKQDQDRGLPLTFEQVRLAQHLRFRSLTPRQKILALEDMQELGRLARQAHSPTAQKQ